MVQLRFSLQLFLLYSLFLLYRTVNTTRCTVCYYTLYNGQELNVIAVLFCQSCVAYGKLRCSSVIHGRFGIYYTFSSGKAVSPVDICVHLVKILCETWRRRDGSSQTLAN